MGYGYGYAGMAWMWPWMLVGALLSLAVVAALVVLIVWLARGGRLNAQPAAGAGNARQILDERYARGDIDEDEYQKRREGLR
jgi:Predicted membrane protein